MGYEKTWLWFSLPRVGVCQNLRALAAALCIWALELSWGPHFLVPNGFLDGNGFRNGSQWVS